MTKATELRLLDPADLETRLAEARKELFNLRFQLATGRLDNITRIQQVRREIARLLTLESERAAGFMPVAKPRVGAHTSEEE
jgi:large subunit ribosomal protein L29